MSIDSEAVFAQRIQALGLGDYSNRFGELGWLTYGNFAFCTNYSVGQADDTPFVENVIVPLLGDPLHPSAAAVRRLFFDAYSAHAADAHRRMQRPEEEDNPRKLPAPERDSRFQAIRARLVGLRFDATLEPSNALVDKFTVMADIGELRYLRWEEFIRRDPELKREKKDKVWKEDAGGSLRSAFATRTIFSDVGSDLIVMKAPNAGELRWRWPNC